MKIKSPQKAKPPRGNFISRPRLFLQGQIKTKIESFFHCLTPFSHFYFVFITGLAKDSLRRHGGDGILNSIQNHYPPGKENKNLF